LSSVFALEVSQDAEGFPGCRQVARKRRINCTYNKAAPPKTEPEIASSAHASIFCTADRAQLLNF
jgi:hypothetical protein